MKIQWIGHSSFLITSSNNTKILTDPFPNTIGYKVKDIYTDIVTISHHHFDHNCLENIKGDYVVLDNPGEVLCEKIIFKGFQSYHDEVNGAKRGPNTIFTFTVDDITICHLGDLGYILDENEINALGKVNVLLIPVGGNYTIDNKEAAKLCKKINSNIIIPMHYHTPSLNFELSGLDDFLISMKNYEKINDTYLTIDDKHSIEKEKNKVFILKY